MMSPSSNRRSCASFNRMPRNGADDGNLLSSIRLKGGCFISRSTSASVMSLLKGTSQRRGLEILTDSSAMKNILRVNHSWTARIDFTTPVDRETNQLPSLEEEVLPGL